MDNDKFIHSIRDKLLNHREAVPHSVWNKIDERLSASPILLKRRCLYIAAAVAVVVVIISLTIFLPQQQSITESQLTNIDTSYQVIDTKSDLLTQNTTTPIQEEKNNNISIQQEQPSNNSKEENHHYDNPTSNYDTPTTPIINQETTLDNTQYYTQAETVTTCDSVNTHSYNEIDTNLPLITYCNNNDSCYEALLQNLQKEISKSQHSSFRLAFEANTSKNRSVTIPYSLRCGEAELTCNHNMPLNVKVLGEKRFGKWSIGTGVSYTFMTSDYEMSHNIRNGKQELHYVGIPLYVGYEIAKINRFSFYTSLGGQVDFNTAAIHIENPDSYAYGCIQEIEFRDKKPQFSAMALIGVACEIIPHLDIFVQPTIGYYFKNDSFIHSLWQDRAWNFSVSCGLRTSF